MKSSWNRFRASWIFDLIWSLPPTHARTIESSFLCLSNAIFSLSFWFMFRNNITYSYCIYTMHTLTYTVFIWNATYLFLLRWRKWIVPTAFAKLFYSLSICKIENSQSILEHVIVESMCFAERIYYLDFKEYRYEYGYIIIILLGICRFNSLKLRPKCKRKINIKYFWCLCWSSASV